MPDLGRLKKEEYEFETNWCYTARSYIRQKNNRVKNILYRCLLLCGSFGRYMDKVKKSAYLRNHY
jgi:hypothetical protein